MSLANIKRKFTPGQVVTVTNHFINREDHPCFGTRQRTITKVTGSHLHFDVGGSLPWPKASQITEQDGVVRWFGHPTPDALFLTIMLGAAS